MKKMVWMVLAAMMVTMGTESMAQPAQRGEGREKMSLEQMAERRTERLTEELKLSKKQAKQMYALQLEEMKRMQLMRQQMRDEKAGSREAMFERMKQARQERAAAYKQVLTPEQFAEWEKMEKEQMKHRHPGMRGGQHPAKKGDKMMHGKQGHHPHKMKKESKEQQ